MPTERHTIFAGELSCPPWLGEVREDVSFYYEWDPDYTTITSIKLNWAVETDAWGMTVMYCSLNGKEVDRFTFTGPEHKSNVANIMGKFFNGPNIFRFTWDRVFNIPWYVNCKLRADVELVYEGVPPTGVGFWEKYKNYVYSGATAFGLGTLIYFLTRRRS